MDKLEYEKKLDKIKSSFADVEVKAVAIAKLNEEYSPDRTVEVLKSIQEGKADTDDIGD